MRKILITIFFLIQLMIRSEILNVTILLINYLLVPFACLIYLQAGPAIRVLSLPDVQYAL